jgi:hypothetical protein
MATDEGSFLSRWSQRKAQARNTVPAEPPAQTATGMRQTAGSAPATAALPALAEAPEPACAEIAPAQAAEPAPTLADVEGLTPESDYTRFVARDVTPEVKNAALKKLFADPQFNVMDGLDIYIGDYHTPDPLPVGMLRQMVQSKMLGLFDDEVEAAVPVAATRPASPAATALNPAPPHAPPPCEPACHENPDLQLQPDDDAGRAGLAPGPGADAGGSH